MIIVLSSMELKNEMEMGEIRARNFSHYNSFILLNAGPLSMDTYTVNHNRWLDRIINWNFSGVLN